MFYDAADVAIVPMGFCYPGRAGYGDATTAGVRAHRASPAVGGVGRRWKAESSAS